MLKVITEVLIIDGIKANDRMYNHPHYISFLFKIFCNKFSYFYIQSFNSLHISNELFPRNYDYSKMISGQVNIYFGYSLTIYPQE